MRCIMRASTLTAEFPGVFRRQMRILSLVAHQRRAKSRLIAPLRCSKSGEADDTQHARHDRNPTLRHAPCSDAACRRTRCRAVKRRYADGWICHDKLGVHSRSDWARSMFLPCSFFFHVRATLCFASRRCPLHEEGLQGRVDTKLPHSNGSPSLSYLHIRKTQSPQF